MSHVRSRDEEHQMSDQKRGNTNGGDCPGVEDPTEPHTDDQRVKCTRSSQLHRDFPQKEPLPVILASIPNPPLLKHKRGCRGDLERKRGMKNITRGTEKEKPPTLHIGMSQRHLCRGKTS